MKRLLSFAAAFMVVLSLGVFAQNPGPNYNTHSATTLITVDVQIPILVTPSTSNLDLGDLAPGTTRLLGVGGSQPTGPNVVFTVNGAYGWPFTVTTTGPTETIPGTGLVTLAGSWYNGAVSGTWTTGTDPVDPLDPFFYLGNDINGAGIANHEVIDNYPTNSGLPTPGGMYYFMYGVESMTADPTATVGTYSFELTLTATYADVAINLSGVVLP